MNSVRRTFSNALRRQLRIWRGGALLVALLRLAGRAVLVGTVLVAADLFLAFSTNALLAVDAVVAAGLVFLAFWEAISCLSPSLREAAERADRLLGDPRRPVLTAFELGAGAAERDWGGFFVERSLRAGEEALARLTWRQVFPGGECLRQARRLALALLPVAALGLWQPEALRLGCLRLARPDRDTPPFTVYRFSVTPDPVRVAYGGSVELTAEIVGAPVRQPVRLLTRKGATVEETVCFRQSDTAFSQRLEKVVDPVEFCFAVGRARSAWRPLEVLRQPKVSLVRLALEPPAYTGLAATDTVLEHETVEGLGGTKARLQLTSNRPLATGSLALVPPDGLGAARTVVGRKTGLHTITFEWELRFAARLEVQVEDVQGTPLAEPLRLRQKLVPDRAPEVAIVEPAAYALATPGATVRIQGTATDDLALRSVVLVRTVAGYRDRSVSLGPVSSGRQQGFRQELALARLGVLPGQVIELFAEARDFNPERSGVGASGIVRLEIISNEEYAEIVRAEETLEQFSARYELVAERLAAVRRTLAALAEELAKPQLEGARVEALLAEARSRHREAQELCGALAGEFQAYALEEKWRQALEELAGSFAAREQSLAELRVDDPALAAKVAALRGGLEQESRRVEQPAALTAEFVQAGRVMEHAARFVQLVNRQRELVRTLARRETEPGERGSPAALGRREEAIREDLAAFLDELERTATALPDTEAFRELRAGALAFAGNVRDCGADALLRRAAEAGRNENEPELAREARLAKERLEELLERNAENAFGGLCRGGLKFRVREELRESLDQLLSSLLGRPGDGLGGGTGSGHAPGGGRGDAGDGYSVASRTRLNTPAIGPARRLYSPGGGAPGGSGEGAGGGGASAGSFVQEVRAAEAAAPELRATPGAGRTGGPVPEKYRRALERYFGQPETTR